MRVIFPALLHGRQLVAGMLCSSFLPFLSFTSPVSLPCDSGDRFQLYFITVLVQNISAHSNPIKQCWLITRVTCTYQPSPESPCPNLPQLERTSAIRAGPPHRSCAGSSCPSTMRSPVSSAR